ncbi:MAG: TIGR01777 family oxidoreductase [Chitinophagaceae bacterium]
MATVLITGGTGMIGRELTKALRVKGHDVIILTRGNRSAAEKGISYAGWDPEQSCIDQEALSKADYIIHLAGAGVADKRWTRKRKQQIADSRVKGGKLLAGAVAHTPNKIKAIISASAIGWYGADDPARGNAFTEADPPAADFLATTCYQWEESIRSVAATGKRVVIFRIGIVLGREGGAWKEFLKPLKWRLATVLGSGKQVMSWIHIDDLVQLFLFALEKDTMTGVYNAVAPQPVTNKALVTAMARSRKKKFIRIRVPSFLLRLLLGEMSIEVLKSATVSAGKILDTSFSFQYRDIVHAAASLSAQASPPGSASL